MLLDSFSTALVLTGATGVGKTALGIELAERLGAEIISMDSMALYRKMDIGTAKPDAEERRRTRHHLIDVLEPWESSTVAWWLDQAAACCREIASRGKRVLFVGGTPLYLKALLCGLFAGPPADPDLRSRLTEEAEREGRELLHRRLARVDPVTAGRLHPRDLRRVVRALEVWELTGRPISSWQTQWGGRSEPGPTHAVRPRVLWLDLPRADLYARIDERVRHMVAAGLVEEGRALLALPCPVSREASQALGYKEIFAHLEGKATLEKTIARIQARSRQYAKRQLTWFRHLPGCRPASRELTFALWGLTIGRVRGEP
jgi:tRNA dimethylallyltransferase